MAQFRYDYTVQLQDGPTVAQMGFLSNLDNYGNIIRLTVFDGTAESDLSTGTISLSAVRADGGTISQTNGTISTLGNNVCYIGLSRQCYTVAGPLQIYVYWTGGSGVKTTLFAGYGEVVVADTGVIGSSVVSDTVSSLITQINNAVAQIPSSYASLEAMIAPNYNSTSKVYKIGELVRYEDTLYMRIKDATGVEATFTSANWQSVTVGGRAVVGAGYLNAVSDCPDANNAVSNKIIGISIVQSASSKVSNLPYDQANGTLVTLGPSQDGGYGAVQMFFAVSAANDYKVFRRIRYASGGNYVWSAWKAFAFGDEAYISGTTLVIS